MHESWWMSLVPYVPMFLGIYGLGRWLNEPSLPDTEAKPDSPRWELTDVKVPLAMAAITAGCYYAVPGFGTWFNDHPFTVVIIGTVALLAWLVLPALLRSENGVLGRGHSAFAGRTGLLAAIIVLQFGMAGLLIYRQANQKLGLPGVKVAAAPMFGEQGQVISTNRVELPAKVLDFASEQTPVAQKVLDWLPKDTTFGQRTYKAADGFQASMNVVLMGTDRTSIHKPQYCLTGAGFRIEKSELTSIRIEEPVPYDLPVMKLTATHDWVSPEGQKLLVRAIYVYWFVSDDQLSADHDQRILLMGLDMLKTGVLKRWAYVSCLGYAFPGREEAVYERLKGLITASVPQFQLVNSPARLASK